MYWNEITELFYTILNILLGVTVDELIGVLASMSLYAYPVLMLFSAKLETRKLDLEESVSIHNDKLRYMYVKKTIFWALMCSLYATSIIIADDNRVSSLSSPTMVVYFGLSWGLITVELKSILASYKEARSNMYVPIFKRYSFWIFMGAAAFKVYTLVIGHDFGTPQQLMAILDLLSYVFMIISFIVFVWFDKKKDNIEKALAKSRKIIIDIKKNYTRSERQRKRTNREIIKVLGILRIYMSYIDDDKKKSVVETQIKELEVLMAVSS